MPRRFSAIFVIAVATFARADDTKSPSKPSAPVDSNKASPGATHTLRYKFQPEELIRWKVTHLADTETTIQGNTQASKSRSASVKLWRVIARDDQGNLTFTHAVDNVEMWQKLSDRPEVRYNSRTDGEVPPEYEQVAKTLGVVLATITVTPDGQIVKREGDAPVLNLGLGDIIMLLPPQPVRTGSRWHEPSEVHARGFDGLMKRIKTRKSYTLERVETGVATITVRTEVLTPIQDARLQSQIVQQLTNGTIKFDINAGRLLSKQMDWDETVLGFNGADSQLRYLARITEELLPAAATASTEKVENVKR